MEQQPIRRSSLFLIELMIAILFFCAASAICILLFVKAHTLENNSIHLNHAVNACTSAAEVLRGTAPPMDTLTSMYPKGSYLSDSAYQVYYSDDWELCPEEDAAFTMEISILDEGTLRKGTVCMKDAEHILYQLDVKKHISAEVTP